MEKTRDNVYNPVLSFIQKGRCLSSKQNFQKLFIPASSKQQFFTLKRHNSKKSHQNLTFQAVKLNMSGDRKQSQDLIRHEWNNMNASQDICLNTSTDDDGKTISTTSYDTHQDGNIYRSSNTKKKSHAEVVSINKTNHYHHFSQIHLNHSNFDQLISNVIAKNQFSHLHSQMYSKKQKSSKQDVLLKFKENLKKKSPSPLKIKNFFLFPKPLGQGTYSKVYKAIHKKTGMICAIKVIEKQQIINSNLINNLIEEIRIMTLYEHENITKLWAFFQEGPKFYMVLEYCTEGYLYNLIKNFSHNIKSELLVYHKKLDHIKQICTAIEFLHEHKIMHRDIKPENILLTMGGIIKISDFGWARIIQNPTEQLRKTLCGTPLYLAPEQIKRSQYSKSVDLWAIGILTYELLTGKIPFTIESIEDLHKIVNQDVSFQEIKCFPHARQFVSLLLEKDGSKRSQAHKLTEHQFFSYETTEFNQTTFLFQLEFGKVL